MGTVTVLPYGRALTRRDLERMPDDGHRYELIDGTLVVTPAPSPRQPDLLVARRIDFTARDLPVAPLLAVEVLSPSTRCIDLTLKRARLEAAGCPSYWVVDPDVPSVTVWQLQGGQYVEKATVSGEESLELDQPYSLTIRPSDLTG